jgi:hypothetical protein
VQHFGVPTGMLGDMLKNATKTNQCFEKSSYNADAKQHRKTRLDYINIALLASFEKTRTNNPEVANSV